MARGGGGRLFEGGDYFKYFGQRGAIIRGRRLIEGRLLFEEIWYFDYIVLLGAKIKLSRVGVLSLANAFTSS